MTALYFAKGLLVQSFLPLLEEEFRQRTIGVKIFELSLRVLLLGKWHCLVVLGVFLCLYLEVACKLC